MNRSSSSGSSSSRSCKFLGRPPTPPTAPALHNSLRLPALPCLYHFTTRLQGKFFEAKCTDILPEERAVVACFPEDAGFPEACFKVSYDYLVMGVG